MRTIAHLKDWTPGTSLRLCPRILCTSLAAARIIFSTLFSCSCSSWVWAESSHARSDSETDLCICWLWKWSGTHLSLCMFEQQTEALILLYPCREDVLALLPCLLHLLLELPQHTQLLGQSAVARASDLQVQLQIQRGTQESIQTFDLHWWLWVRMREERGGNCYNDSFESYGMVWCIMVSFRTVSLILFYAM